MAPPAPRSVTAVPPPPPVCSPDPLPAGPPAAAPAPPASSRTSTVRMDSTVPHNAQLLAGTGLRPGSAGRASLCFSESPLCSQPVTAPTPIRLAISTETARPVKRGSIRIYPVLERACLRKLFLPPLESRGNRWHECNPRANIRLSSSLNSLSRIPAAEDFRCVDCQ